VCAVTLIHFRTGGFDEAVYVLQQAENIARSLPEPTCTILRSCYWEKKTYQQVADELGISPDTVKKHISKALRTLREAILKKEDKQ
jgi:RNA polymerase sigma factor (sigma-70 family)